MARAARERGTGRARQFGEAQYSRAFDIWSLIAAEERHYDRAGSDAARRRIKANIRRLKLLVVPRESVLKADRRRPIVAKCLEYIRQHGAPRNIRQMFNWMKAQGVMSGPTEHGKLWSVSETKFRLILHEVFGVYGSRGPGVNKKAKKYQGLTRL